MEAKRYTQFRLLTATTTEEITIQQLFYKYTPHIKRYLKYKGAEEITDDVIQDAFLVFVQKNREREISDPKAFLFKIVKNLTNNHFKKKALKLSLTSPFEAVEKNEDSSEKCKSSFYSDPFLLKEVEQDKKDKIKHIKDLIETHLTAYQKNILTLKYFRGMTYEEIARDFKKPSRNIRKAASEAIKKIRNLMP